VTVTKAASKKIDNGYLGKRFNAHSGTDDKIGFRGKKLSQILERREEGALHKVPQCAKTNAPEGKTTPARVCVDGET